MASNLKQPPVANNKKNESIKNRPKDDRTSREFFDELSIDILDYKVSHDWSDAKSDKDDDCVTEIIDEIKNEKTDECLTQSDWEDNNSLNKVNEALDELDRTIEDITSEELQECLIDVKIDCSSKSDQASTVTAHESIDETISPDMIRVLDLIGLKEPNQLQKAILMKIIDKNKDFFVRSNIHTGRKTSLLIAAIDRVNLEVNETQVIIVMPTKHSGYALSNQATDLCKSKEVKIDCDFIDLKSKIEEFNCHILITTLDAISRCMNSHRDLNMVKLLIFYEFDVFLSQKASNDQLRYVLQNFSQIDRCRFQIYTSCNNRDSYGLVRDQIGEAVILLNYLNLDFPQYLHFVSQNFGNHHKAKTLINVVNKIALKKVMIFTSSVYRASYQERRIRAECREMKNLLLLNEDLESKEKLEIINKFNSSEESMIITQYPQHIGFKFNDLRVIINYDMPHRKCLSSDYVYSISACETINDQQPNFVINLINVERGKYCETDYVQILSNFKMIKLQNQKNNK